MAKNKDNNPRRRKDVYDKDGGRRFDDYVHDEFPNPLETAARLRREEREYYKKIFSSWLWVEIPLFFVFLGIIGMVVLYHQELHKNNDCGMTYIYKPMIFVPMEVRGNRLEKYSLLRYHEGYRDERVLNIDIPVLFVPGSSGSAKQVRSLATTILNGTAELGSNIRTRFVFFTCDFDEEFSFLSGATLIRQREFVVQSIETILKAYSQTGVTRLLLIGHSFGGTILHSLPAHPRVDPKWMDLVITLGAPISRPPFKSDFYMQKFYENTIRAWDVRAKELTHVTVISYSGGLKDFMVPDHLARAPFKYSKERGVYPIPRDSRVLFRPSWSVREVGCDVDHNCLAWCNQLIKHISAMVINYGTEWKLPKEGAMNPSRQLVRNFYKNRRGPEIQAPARKDPQPLFDNSIHVHEDVRKVKMTKEFPYVTIDLDVLQYDLIVYIRAKAGSCPAGVIASHPDLTFRSSENYTAYSIQDGEWMYFRIMSIFPETHRLKGVVRIGGTPECEYEVESSYHVIGTLYRRLMDSTSLPYVVFYTLFLFAFVPMARNNRLSCIWDFITGDFHRYFYTASCIVAVALALYLSLPLRFYVERNGPTFFIWAIGARLATFLIARPLQPLLRVVSRWVESCGSSVRGTVRLLLSILSLIIAAYNVALGNAFVLTLHLFKVGPHSKNGLILLVFSISILISVGLAGNVRDGPSGIFERNLHGVIPKGYFELVSHIFYEYPHPLLFSFITSIFCLLLNLSHMFTAVDDGTKEVSLALFYSLVVMSTVAAGNLESLAASTAYFVLLFEVMKEFKGLKAGDGKEID